MNRENDKQKDLKDEKEKRVPVDFAPKEPDPKGDPGEGNNTGG